MESTIVMSGILTKRISRFKSAKFMFTLLSSEPANLYYICKLDYDQLKIKNVLDRDTWHKYNLREMCIMRSKGERDKFYLISQDKKSLETDGTVHIVVQAENKTTRDRWVSVLNHSKSRTVVSVPPDYQ